jgi:hypothetical protein
VNTAALKQALENFLASPDFSKGVRSSTLASWRTDGSVSYGGGGSYSVELSPDGTSRVEDTKKIGKLNNPSCVILEIPAANVGIGNNADLDLMVELQLDDLADQLRGTLAGKFR